jgi:hypothetical protein
MTLDRTGEPVEPDEHDCQGGWIDRDADHPVPCLVCRPHLAPAQRHRRAHGIDAQPTTEETRNA